MQIGAAYLRVSTEEQTEYSPDAQLNAIKDYAKKNDILIAEEFIFRDEGISGRKADKRPAFQAMISTAKKKPKPFDVILVHKFDRFARNREDSIVYKSLLRKDCGIKVISITEPMEDDKMAVIMEAMLEAMAEYYSLNLSDEVKKGMSEKARRGGVLSRAPFGYKNTGDGKTPIIIPEEADIVRLMFEKIHSGEMSPFTLARYLNNTNMLTRKGATWGTYTVKYVLSNAFYCGVSVWNKQQRSTMLFRDRAEWITAKGQHEPIISTEMFEEVQNILNASKYRRERPASQYCHWLSGLLKCSNCGGSMSASSHAKYPFFQCHNYNKGKCDVSHYAPINSIERAVYDALDEFVNNPDCETQYEKKISFGINEPDKADILQANLKKANEKLNRVRNAFAAGIDTIDEYKENKFKITQEIENIQTEIAINNKNCKHKSPTIDIANIKKEIMELAGFIRSENNSIQEKNEILKSHISKIVFDKNTKKIEVFYFYD